MDFFPEEFERVIGKYGARNTRRSAKRFDAKAHVSASCGADVMRHLNWMLGTLVPRYNSGMSPEKKMRWLCFVQGVLWSHGLLTIDEAKLDNYRILNGCDPEPEQKRLCAWMDVNGLICFKPEGVEPRPWRPGEWTRATWLDAPGEKK